jgi:hypothetical protein
MKKYVTILYCQYCVNIIGLPEFLHLKFLSYDILKSLVISKSKYHK